VLEKYETLVKAINHTVDAYIPLFAGLMATTPQPAEEVQVETEEHL
jgi:hypothetical protein